MGFEISSALLHFLVRELQVLRDGKVEKIYQLDKNDVVFRVYSGGVKRALRFVLPGGVFLCSQSFSAPRLPLGFCMFLRKYLDKARLVSVEQRGFERILVLKFLSRGEEFFLVAELFKPGNLVLCREENGSLVVINSLSRQKFRDRVVRSREVYEFPPALVNPLEVSAEELVSLLDSSDRSVVKTLASRLGLGGVYAEELLFRAGVDKDKSGITLDEASVLISTFKSFFGEPIRATVSGSNVFPVRMLTEKGEDVESISAGIDGFFPLVSEKQSEVVEKKKGKTSSLVSIQEKMIRDLEEKVLENQSRAEFIYSNYQDFKLLLDKANKIREEKGLVALEEEMKKNPRFKSLNKKDKELILSF